MTNWATPEDVEKAASNWTPGQKACRVYGHAWQPLQVSHRPGLYTVRQWCPRCRNERRQEIDERGYPQSKWHPSYQDGYLLKNIGRVGVDGRAILRLDTLLSLPVVEEAMAE
jgi:hypothetical protein